MPNWTKEQSDAIIKDKTNIIVSAAAGSGKTAVLSERVLRKLKDGVSLDNLLILTFTNAAAFEMKERIRKKIKDEPSLKEELYKIDSSYITTFDSYALSIVKKYGYLLNISSSIGIIEKSVVDIEKRKIIDEIFDEKYNLEDEKFLNFIDTFCCKDDKEIKNTLLTMYLKLTMIYDLDSYLDNYINLNYNDNKILSNFNKYEELLLDKVSTLNILVDEIKELVEIDYYEKLISSIGKLLESKNYDNILKNINDIPKLPRNSDDEVKQLKEKINNILKELTNLCMYETKEEFIKSIYKTKSNVEVIIDIIKELNTRLFKFKFNLDLYEFNDIASMAIKILKENEDIKDEIKFSLNEILIDEYQDTSDLQDLFISQIENNNCYVVGDIKQSIYRFRNANPDLFKNKYESYTDSTLGIKIDLNKNFRSRSEVIDNINLIFSSIMTNEIGGADYNKSHSMVFGNTSYETLGSTNQNNNIEIYNYDYLKESNYKKEEIEAFIMAYDIKEKIDLKYQIFDKDLKVLRDIKYSDIAILIDKKTNFNLYKRIFEYLNIPISIYDDLKLTENIIVNIIKNIISLFINDSTSVEFKYSFISVCRSYLFNMDDNEIFNLFKNNSFKDSIVFKKLGNINPNLDIKELILKIVSEFEFYEKIITVGNVYENINTLDYLINIAEDLKNIGYSKEDFYNYLCEILDNDYEIKYSPKIDESGVKMMSIHKSKGLEFHICYFPNLYFEFNISELKEKFIFDKNYGIVSTYFEDGYKNTFYKELLKQDYLKEEISERIRLLYVALTRAKEKMILIIPNSSKTFDINDKLKYRSFLDIILSIKDKLLPFYKYINLDNINLTKDYNFVKKTNYKDFINRVDDKIIVDELKNNSNIKLEKHFSDEVKHLIDKKEYNNLKMGINIHSIFENADFNNLEKNPYKNEIMPLVNTKIFEGCINIYKEYEFIYKIDNITYHGVIDLLLEFNDHFKIVDYKLKNIDNDAYINQLNGYKKYIEKISKKPAKTYLYSILEKKLIEIN